MSRPRIFVATLLGLGLGPAALAGQTTGQVVGRVTDVASGAPVAGAEVRILERAVLTDAEGDYVLIALRPGRHEVTVRAVGYTPRTLLVSVEAGVSATVDVRLQPGIVLEQITVEAERTPLLTPDVAASRQTVSAEDLATTPIEDIRQALELRTGITDGHFRGGRAGQETYVVDGIDTRNQFAQSQGALAFEVAASAIQEVSVFTSGFTADQASALSGVVNVVTRSGPDDRWVGRLELAGDDWAPGSLARGYGRLGVSLGGPLGPLRVFGDLTLFTRADRDPRVHGLTCLPVTGFTCPAERTIIPHQGGDRVLGFAKLDLPMGPGGGLALSLQRNRDQHELYATRFKYALDDYLAEREVATLVALTGRGIIEPSGSRALLVSGRAAWGRIDRHLGVLAPDQPGTIGRFQPGGYRFRGEDYVRGPIEAQIASGNIVPGYRSPSDAGTGSPWGIFGGDVFATDGTSNVAAWTQTDFLQFRGDLQALVSPQHDLKLGGEVKLFRIASYQHVHAGVPGALPSFVRFYPRTVAGWFHNTLHALDAVTIDLGLRVEGFQPRVSYPEDRSDPGSAVATTSWTTILHPRVGFAMPLAMIGLDRASMRWTFGRFSQPPDFQFFFDQALDDSLNTALRRQGNPNLAYERALQYEAGFDYLAAPDLVLRFTAFYKDLTGLTSSGITVQGSAAGTFTNLDFGHVAGLEWRGEYRPAGRLRVEAGYALQRAVGTVSSAFDSVVTPGRDITELEVPLQFDRRHAINLQAYLPWRGLDLALGASVTSGAPAPDDATRRLPWTAAISARGGWRTAWHGADVYLFFEGRNLLGRDNLVAERPGGGVLPDVAAIDRRAAEETEDATPIPRESPWYSPFIDRNGDQVLSPQEQYLARRGALLDAAEPTLLYGEARQVRIGIELQW